MITILDSLQSLSAVLAENRPSRVVIVSSQKVRILHKVIFKEMTRLCATDSSLAFITVSDGEKLKEWKMLEKLLKDFSNAGIDRKSLVIAVGGGTVGDVVGFACGIYQRGISYINVPTTLVAQADSSIGGKTGVNFNGYKNQIGVYHNPLATVLDARFLQTLTRPQIIDGLGEIIKCGFIKDVSILRMLKKKTLEDLTITDLTNLAQKALLVKKYFVEKDPFDKNIRNVLNVGHTIGHAVELAYKLSHGEAVLVGMRNELEIGESLKITQKGTLARFESLLDGLGIKINKNYKINFNSIKKDKKISAGEILFPFVVKPGHFILKKISLDLLGKTLL